MSDASSGTKGSFELWDGDVKICKVYWDCPWGSKENIFRVTDVNGEFIVDETGDNLDSGAIGNVTVKIAKWL
jgi:hypothetical protein